MTAVHRLVHHPYMIGCRYALGDRSLELLTNIFSSSSSRGRAVLEGRAPVHFITLPEVGPVVVKTYRRGGVLSWINRDRYVKSGQLRSQREFDFLIAAQKAGVRVPVPVAYVVTRAWFYKAWLVTREVKGHQSFARLCRVNPEKARTFIPEISRNIACLIKQGIHHVDLHPGNIILDKNNTVFVIDFDKACWCSKNETRLAEAYQNRWARAVHKYNLSKPLTCLELTERC